MRIKALFPVIFPCFDWLIFWLHGPGDYVFSPFGVDRMCKRTDYYENLNIKS